MVGVSVSLFVRRNGVLRQEPFHLRGEWACGEAALSDALKNGKQ